MTNWRKTSFESYIRSKAQATNPERGRVIEILKLALKEGRFPKFRARPSTQLWDKYDALVPPELLMEAGRLWRTYEKFVREETANYKANRELRWRWRRNPNSPHAPKREEKREAWPWLR